MKGIYWQTLTFKKSVIYLTKVNYTSYSYMPCNSTWMCLLTTNFLIFSLIIPTYPWQSHFSNFFQTKTSHIISKLNKDLSEDIFEA